MQTEGKTMSQHHVRHELAGVDADGEVNFRMASLLSAGKIEELGVEMRFEELGKSNIESKAPVSGSSGCRD